MFHVKRHVPSWSQETDVHHFARRAGPTDFRPLLRYSLHVRLIGVFPTCPSNREDQFEPHIGHEQLRINLGGAIPPPRIDAWRR